MSLPLASVVICTYNRADILREALASVLRQDPGGACRYEVVVVDDGSTDDTRAVVEAAKPEAPVRYVFQEGRGGIAPARNRGVEEAQGDWVIFFDDDQLAEPGWLERLTRVAREKGADCVGGPRRLAISEADRAKLGPVCRGILGENLYTGEAAILQGKELPTTGNLLLSRRLFETIGVFDPNAKSSGEDADLLRRARRGGFAIWTSPEAMVGHMIPAYRLTAPYFRWVSLRWGNQFARMDFNRGGCRRLWALGLGRIAQALLVHAPRWAAARLRHDAPAAMDRAILLWRAWGYARSMLHYTAPGLFAQRRFMEQLQFRNERELFSRGENRSGAPDQR